MNQSHPFNFSRNRQDHERSSVIQKIRELELDGASGSTSNTASTSSLTPNNIVSIGEGEGGTEAMFNFLLPFRDAASHKLPASDVSLSNNFDASSVRSSSPDSQNSVDSYKATQHRAAHAVTQERMKDLDEKDNEYIQENRRPSPIATSPPSLPPLPASEHDAALHVSPNINPDKDEPIGVVSMRSRIVQCPEDTAETATKYVDDSQTPPATPESGPESGEGPKSPHPSDTSGTRRHTTAPRTVPLTHPKKRPKFKRLMKKCLRMFRRLLGVGAEVRAKGSNEDRGLGGNGGQNIASLPGPRTLPGDPISAATLCP